MGMSEKEQFKAVLKEIPMDSYSIKTRLVLLNEFAVVKNCFPGLKHTSRNVRKAGKPEKLVFLEGKLHLDEERDVGIRVIYGSKYPKECPSVHVVPQAGERVKEWDWVDAEGMVRTDFMRNWRKGKRNTTHLLLNLVEIMRQESPIELEIRRESMANVSVCSYSEGHMTTKACICSPSLIYVCSACLSRHITECPYERCHYLYDCSQLNSFQSEAAWEDAYREVAAILTKTDTLQGLLASQVQECKRVLQETTDLFVAEINARQKHMENRLNAIWEKQWEQLESIREGALRLVLNPGRTPVPGTLEELVWTTRGTDLPEKLQLISSFELDWTKIGGAIDLVLSPFLAQNKV